MGWELKCGIVEEIGPEEELPCIFMRSRWEKRCGKTDLPTLAKKDGVIFCPSRIEKDRRVSDRRKREV